MGARGGGDMIGRDEEQPVAGLYNERGRAQCVLVCEHASNVIPGEFGDLGLDGEALRSHVAWDPGALAVATGMADRLDAPLVHQRVSRLVYDCNRPPHEPSAMPASSEVYRIPGNEGLSDAAKADRVARFYEPFRRTLSTQIDQRLAAPALVTIHTFTPVYFGRPRAVEVGILHDDDARLADAVIVAAKARGTYAVERNRPYGPQDGVTHTLREHALPRHLPNVMIEIRNDLVADADGQRAMADWLSAIVSEALESTGRTPCPVS